MTFDVAVLGAGPSGSWTAYRLAQSGVRVVLFDPAHPREKPCGGGVTGRALALVHDAIRPESLARVDVDRARFVSTFSPDASDHEPASVPLSAGALSIFSRSRFDGRLFEAAQEAGAEAVPERVSRIEKDGQGFRLETATRGDWRARFVVGADGPNGLVRRRLVTAFERAQLSIATGYFIRERTSREILLEFVTDPPGYLWSFPRNDHLAVGICAQADAGVSADELRRRAATWIEHTGVARGGRLEPYSWPIPSLTAHAVSTLPAAGDGWLLVGDAAGLVDSITREGIFYALVSAEHAAAAIVAGGPIARTYERGIRELRDELARAARLKQTFFRTAFVDLVLRALKSSPRIRSVMADLVAGTQSYRDLKWRLAKTCEFTLAWQLLGPLSATRPTNDSQAKRPDAG